MQAVEERLRERGAHAPQPTQGAVRMRALPRLGPMATWRNSTAAVQGTLIWPPRCENGFGYDPMFLPDAHPLTFGEMTNVEKHGLPPAGKGLSHRARAS